MELPHENPDTQPPAAPKPYRRRRRAPRVGEDIRCPALIESTGTLRIRTPRAAQVAEWFALPAPPRPTPSAHAAQSPSRTQPSRDPRSNPGPRSASDAPALDAPDAPDAPAPHAPAPHAPAPDAPSASAAPARLKPRRKRRIARVTETPRPLALPPLVPGTITLITGPSGAGKSTLFRATRDAHPARPWIDLAALTAPDLPLVDCFGADLPLPATLALLARVGLGEAWTYLRTPAELSEGQHWRFRLALALQAARAPADVDAAGRSNPHPHPLSPTQPRAHPHENRHARSHPREAAHPYPHPPSDAAHPIIACDEFAAVLDRVTAVIVAHRLRRAIDAMPHACALLATSHEDLEPALAADVTVRCDFGMLETQMAPK